MTTRITPAALERSNFRKVHVGGLRDADFDEVFHFTFPSPDPIDEVNGDGILREVTDYDYQGLYVHCGNRKIAVTPDTILYVR